MIDALQRSRSLHYAFVSDDGAIVEINQAFSAALGVKVSKGDPLRSIQHPLAKQLNDMVVSKRTTPTIGYGSMVYRAIDLDQGGAAIVGMPNDTGDSARSIHDSAFQRSYCPMLILDPSTGRILDANPAATDLYGHSREALSAMDLKQIVAEPLEMYLYAKAGRLPDQHRLASRKVIDAEVSTSQAHLARPGLLCAAAHSASEQEGAEMLFSQDEGMYRALADASFEGMVIHSDLVMLECNHAFEELIGAPQEQLIGTSILDLVAEESRDLVIGQVTEKRHDPYETTIRPRDGSVRITEVRGRDVYYCGRPARVAAFLDLTESRSATKGLESERAKLLATMRSLPVGVIMTDALGGFVETSDMTADIWGGQMEASDLVDYERFAAYDPSTGDRIRPEERGLSRALLQGETSVGEVVDIVRFDGGRRTIVVSAAPIRNASGEIQRGIEIAQDITHQKELEKQARIDKERAELHLNVLAHDINNIISVVMGYMQLIRQQGVLDGRTAYQLDRSLAALQDCHALIANVQKVQGAGEEARGRNDMSTMLASVVSAILVPHGREVYIEQECEEGLIVESADLLREAFVNLLSNAIDHTSGAVHIWVRGRGVKDRAIITIEDDGNGIDDARKKCIFDRRSGDMGRRPGHGLGLFLTRWLVEEHGGLIRLEDRVLYDHTQGAKFVIELPLAGCWRPDADPASG